MPYSKVTKSSHFILGNRILLSLGVLYSTMPEMIVKWKKNASISVLQVFTNFLINFCKSVLFDDLC